MLFRSPVFDWRNGGGYSPLIISINTSRIITFALGLSGGLASTQAVALNSWSRVAFARINNTLRCYIDGNPCGSVSNTTNYTANGFMIGAANDTPTGYYFGGYLDEIRITVGSGRGYDGSVKTPPTAPFPNG